MATSLHEAQEHDQDHAAHAPGGHAEDSHAGEGHEAHGHDPLSPDHLFGHVRDADYFEVPKWLGGKWHLPQWFKQSEPIATVKTGTPLVDDNIAPLELKFTKFMALELIAAAILVLLFTRLAAQLKRSDRARGPLANALEAVIVFIRDDIARPAIGHHDADHFMPFLLTAFFFVATRNLLGLVPWAGSATGAMSTTIALALMTLFTVLFSGMAKLGPVGYWAAQVPHMDVQPKPLAWLLQGMIFAIELFGLLVKHFVLAIRLFANMLAGHVVLAVVLAFIAATAQSWAFYGVMPASIGGAVALSFLELMVAFIQAYVFTFLSALFIGMAVHPH